MEDRTVRDLFPALAVQLERESSETPSIESNESAVLFVHDSPTPRASTLHGSIAAQGSVSAAFQHSDALRSDTAPSKFQVLLLEGILRNISLQRVPLFLLVVTPPRFFYPNSRLPEH